jgi:hypothetical protein
MRTSTLISPLSATALLAPFIPVSQYVTLTHYSYALVWLVNDCGYSESIALHLVLFAYAEEVNSEPIRLPQKLSV